jgi:hypothetical protein
MKEPVMQDLNDDLDWIEMDDCDDPLDPDEIDDFTSDEECGE